MGPCQSNEKRGIVVPSPSSHTNNASLDVLNNESKTVRGGRTTARSSSMRLESSSSKSSNKNKKHNNERGRSRGKGDINNSTSGNNNKNDGRKLSPAPSKQRKSTTTTTGEFSSSVSVSSIKSGSTRKLWPVMTSRGGEGIGYNNADDMLLYTDQQQQHEYINNDHTAFGSSSPYSADNDEEWRSVCIKYIEKIVDPLDFISVVDERVSSITNYLSPAELLRIQRHTRSVLREFKSGGGKSIYYKDINYNYGTSNKQQRLIDEPVFRKIFASGDVHIKEIVDIATKRSKEESLRLMAFNDAVAATEREYLSDTDGNKSIATLNTITSTNTLSKKKEKKERASSYFSKLKPNNNNNNNNNASNTDNINMLKQYKIDDADIVSERVDILGSAFLLLSYMSSEGVLEYVSSLADIGFTASGLDLDTLHLFNTNSYSNNDKDGARIPSILSVLSETTNGNGNGNTKGNNNNLSTADLQQPLGLTYGALCAFIGMALYGSRQQRLCLLFHLLIPPKLLKISLIARGLFPTWLLDIDSDVILSIYSLIYFYYTPSTTNKQSKFPLWPMKISARIGIDVLCMLISSGNIDAHDLSATKDHIPNDQNTTTGETSDDFLSVGSNTTTTTNQKHSNITETFESVTPTSDVTWTYTQFQSWANISLTDDHLNTIFHKLFGDQILHTPQMELDSIKERWINWEKTDFKYWQKKANKKNTIINNNSFSDSFSFNTTSGNDEGKDEMDVDDITINDADKNSVGFFAKLFYGSNFSSNGNNTGDASSSNHHHHNQNNSPDDDNKDVLALQSHIRSDVFGGLGGIDGRGGLGFGLMYCIDKYWWDHWTRYTHWTWKQHTNTTATNNTKQQITSIKKPGEITNEILLEPHDSSYSNIVRGTMGSYDIMKSSCRKDIDYILIPPPVWDLLYELYGGGPPLPRMILSPKQQQQQHINDNDVIVQQHQEDSGDNHKNNNDDGNDNVQIFCNVANTNILNCPPLLSTDVQEACCSDSTCTTDGDGDGDIVDRVEVVVKPEEKDKDIITSSFTDSANNVSLSTSSTSPTKIPTSLFVSSHPWIISCQMCDPHQPYRRGDAGTLSIHVMTTPDQPLWRFFAEINFRLPVHHPKGRDSGGRGKARLWKRDAIIIHSSSSVSSPSNNNSKYDTPSSLTSSRYGPWSLLCKNRFASIPVLQLNEGHHRNGSMVDNNASANHLSLKEYIRDWEAYTDHATVESVGLSDGMRVMLEHALVSKNGNFSWPREAAAKAGRVRRLVEEDASFRRWLRAVDIQENICRLQSLEGTTIDAMDPSGRWYQALIVQVDKSIPLPDNITNNELSTMHEDASVVGISSEHAPSPSHVTGENYRVLLDFSGVGGAEEWIRVDSDRLAVSGRFTIDSLKTLVIESDDQSVVSSSIIPSSDSSSRLKITSAANRKLAHTNNDSSTVSSEVTSNNNGSGICPFPGYGACGLSNLGNTCYANAALQCIAYMPLLRCYLLSGMYRADINRDNPLGTGGKLLEEYADLLRVLWSGKFSCRAPTKFRSQLGKARSQFSANDQQDAQELLNAMLDALHEDSSKIKKKSLVPPLDDAWVMQNSLPRVGLEAWRRYLRRNRSIIAHIAYGQVLNRVTCPVCNHSSLNFDPFNMLSLPFPTISEVNFRCIVIRRGTALNCPRTLIRKRKDSSISCNEETGENRSINSTYSSDSVTTEDVITAPSDHVILEEYIVAMSRLADVSDLKIRLQNYCGIAANCLKLGKAEEVIVNNELPANNPLRSCINVTALPDNQGPCSQLAKLPVTCNDNVATPVTAPILLMAFESTLRPRPPDLPEEEDTDSTEEEVNSSQEGDTTCLTIIEEGRLPSLTVGGSGEESNSNTPKGSNKRQRALETQLQLYGDYQECCIFDTDPTPLSKAMSRILWPKAAPDFKLGLRVDAIDHRNHWYPGTVVEIIETEDQHQKQQPKQQWNDEGELVNSTTKVRIHFDNFSSKWDEIYGIEHFHRGQVRPLYSHATPRSKPLEFLVHHRHGIMSHNKNKPLPALNGTNSNSASTVSLFGQSFFLQCHSEWSTARAGAHILAQASRFMQCYYPQMSTSEPMCNGTAHESELEDTSVSSSNINRSNSEDTYRVLEDAHSVIAEIIRVLVDIDRKYVKCALSLGRFPNDQHHHRSSRSLRNPSSFNATSMTMSLSKKLSTLLPRLPFEVRVCAAESTQGGYGTTPSDEVTFPFSLVRTIGNYMNARLAIVLHWHAVHPDSSCSSSVSSRGRFKTNVAINNNNASDGSVILYSSPVKHIHKESHFLLAESASEDSASDHHISASSNHQAKTVRNRKKSPINGGMHLGVCLTEFCKEQQLPEGWKCPRCKVDREGRQSMKLWRLPDLLTFHIKRFNCSARWREKISTKVNFPLTGLDLGEWCDLESPALSSDESNVYDLIGVINHLGGMTGGHYVAVCKATQCGVDGSEEVAHSFNGYRVSSCETEEEIVQTGWRLGRNREKDSASSTQRAAVAASRSLSRSSEPLWLQFDDDLVEPIPPRAVVSEGAYVLFYRRRRLTPSNIAKYSTPD